MQSAQEIALTPALSPEEREKLSCTARHPLISDSFQRGQTRFPLTGESDRVRASPFILHTAETMRGRGRPHPFLEYTLRVCGVLKPRLDAERISGRLAALRELFPHRGGR